MRHEFVEFIPEELREGVLHVSIPYATATHLCACGCGIEIVTPLSPADWEMTFNGETVSLWPSIGSWGLPCRSHYFIERGDVRLAKKMSLGQIEKGRTMSQRWRERWRGGELRRGARFSEEAPATRLLARTAGRRRRSGVRPSAHPNVHGAYNQLLPGEITVDDVFLHGSSIECSILGSRCTQYKAIRTEGHAMRDFASPLTDSNRRPPSLPCGPRKPCGMGRT